jgi:glutamate racemase
MTASADDLLSLPVASTRAAGNGDRVAVGVWDSGVGGLSVLRHCRLLLPGVEFHYIADQAYAPYGPRPAEWIAERSLALARFLIAQADVAALVVACNSATAAAAEHLRSHLDTPVVAMEPGIKPAVALTRSGKVGVLATPATLGSKRFRDLIERHAGPAVEVFPVACPGLVERIESGDLDGPETRALVSAGVLPLLAAGVDTLVLGCTHYPWLAPLIGEVAGEGVRLVDTGPAVAMQLVRCLELAGQEPAEAGGSLTLWSSARPDELRELSQRLLQQSSPVFSLPEDLRPC